MNISFPSTLVHVTTLSSLYDILRSNYLLTRRQTGSSKGFSSENEGDPNYIYLSLNTSNPSPGYVKIVLDSSILLDRNDYYLNTDWFYGITSKSLLPVQIQTWLRSVTGPGEILFMNEIPLDLYLKEIIVPQLDPNIIKLILKHDHNRQLPILDINKIPLKYRDKIRIIYQ